MVFPQHFLASPLVKYARKILKFFLYFAYIDNANFNNLVKDRREEGTKVDKMY